MADRATVVACPHCGTRNRVRPVASGVPRCSVCHHRLPWIVEADADSFEAEIHASVPVLVDFWAPWCGPCRMVSPAVERVGQERAGSLKVVKLDIDQAPGLAQRFDVKGIPLLMIFKDGVEAERLVGAVSAEQLQRWLEPHYEAVDERA